MRDSVARPGGLRPVLWRPLAVLAGGGGAFALLVALYRATPMRCTGSTLEPVCAALRGAPALGMALAVGAILFLMLDGAARRDLVRRLGAGASCWPGILLGTGGLALALLPLALPETQLASPGPGILAAMAAGAVGIAAGMLRALLPWRDWSGWLVGAEGRPLLAAATALILPALAGALAEPLGAGPMTDAAFLAAVLVLLCLGQPVTTDLDARILGIDPFHVDIIATCSGVEGLMLTLALAAGLAWHGGGRLRQWPYWGIVVPVALVLAWGLNVLRITGIVLIGAYLSPGHALGGFHAYAGWFAFLAVAVLLIRAARHPRLRRG